MAYYLQACGRADLQIVPLYDTHYAPRDGDLIVLEPSRRFFETQRFFDALGNSGMSHSDSPRRTGFGEYDLSLRPLSARTAKR